MVIANCILFQVVVDVTDELYRDREVGNEGNRALIFGIYTIIERGKQPF
jgi:hypothetical protein